MNINLLPPHLRQEEEKFPWKAALLTFALGWLCAFLLVFGWGQVRFLEQRLELSQPAKEQAQLVLGQLAAAEKRLESVSRAQRSLWAHQRSSEAFGELLSQLRWHVPEDMWFTSLEINETGRFLLTGRVFSLAGLSSFLMELRQLPQLQEPVLQSTTRKDAYYEFQIEAKAELLQAGGE